MRKLLFGLTLFIAVISFAIADPIDLRSYIDSGALYPDADSLKTVGTYSDTVFVVGANKLTCNVTLNDVATNVVLRLECSPNGVLWTNCDPDGNDTTLTTDGTYSFVFEHAAVFEHYRLYFVSEAGGTIANMYITFKVGDRVAREI